MRVFVSSTKLVTASLGKHALKYMKIRGAIPKGETQASVKNATQKNVNTLQRKNSANLVKYETSIILNSMKV